MKITWPEGTFMRLKGRGRLLDALDATDQWTENGKPLSRAELAFLACCSKPMIQHLLAGRKKTCTPELATRIAQALRVDVSELFTEEREVPAPAVSSVPAVTSTPGRVTRRINR